MPHAIWSGAINFGLVTIPVKIFSAVRANELRFNFLHKTDQGRIQNVRRCSIDGEDVPYSEIVRGYEYTKGEYVIISDEDLKSVAAEATQSVDIVQFVELSEINPMFFDTPYYLEPEKKGRHAYALLREALKTANKVAIARVVLRSREHLAAVKPNGNALVLELMHYADEIVDQSDFDFPEQREHLPEGEMKVAKMLIDSMSTDFQAEQFRDEYRQKLLGMIDARVAGKEVPYVKTKAPAATNVVNLMDVLQRSLEQTQAKRGRKAETAGEPAPARKATAKRSASKSAPKTRRKRSAA